MKKKNNQEQLKDIQHFQQEIEALRLLCDQKTTENDNLRKGLDTMEWMLKPKQTAAMDFVPDYGDLSSLNEDGLIRRSIPKHQLQDIVSEYLDLLETSAAIYEKNGDYALGIFSSGWCRMMDAASRRLCNTDDNRKALASGKWLCHDSCWKDASIKSMAEGKPVEVACNGGIHLYAVPVWANKQIIGAINFGFGSPPKDDAELKKLSKKYKLPLAELKKQSNDYIDRPEFVIDYAKQRIEKSAQYLGYLVERKMAEDRLLESKERFRATFFSIGDGVITTDKDGRITNMNPAAEHYCGWTYTEAANRPLSEVFRIVNAKTRKTVADPVKKVLKSKKVIGLANHTVLISKSGKEYQIADTAAPIKNRNGEITGVVLVFSDVTDKYRAEQQLERTKERYRILSETSSDFTFSCLKRGKGYEVDWMAGAVERITGYSFNDIKAKKNWRFMVHPDDDPIFVKHVLSLNPGEESECELRIIDRPGAVKWLSVNTICLSDERKEKHTIYGGCEDITENKRSETALLRTQKTVDKSPLSVFWISPEGKFIYVNETAAKKLQYAREELLSMHVWDIDPNYPREKRKEMFNLYRETVEFSLESAHRRSDGRIYPVKINSYYLAFEDQEMEIAEAEDITELKRAEEALRESEEQHRRLFETMSQGVIYQAADGRIVSANPAAERMLGLSFDQMRGKTSMDPRWKMITEDGEKVPGSDHPSMIALRTGEKVGPVTRGIYIPEKDEYVWLSITATPLFKPGEDKPFQSYAVFDDITFKKLHEDEIKKQQQLIHAILNKLPLGIAVNTIEAEPKVELVNNRFAQIYGVNTEDLPTVESFWEAVYEDEAFREEIKTRVLTDINSGDPKRMQWYDIPITRNGKVVKYISAQNIPLKEHGLIISTVMDTTERKLAEIEIVNARNKAEESDRLKSAFLANMSHEIRTPMNGILGFAELLKNPRLTDEQQQQYIEIIEKGGARMLNIINDIVDISRIESGIMEVSLAESDINELLDYTISFFKPEVEAKGMRLLLTEVLPKERAMVVTDREKVLAILTNLVKNAIKYSNKGTIEFGCNKKGSKLEFFVKDTGIGIPKDRQQAIFDRFVQADIEDKEARQGAGLGLAISKSYVEMLGGEIWVESKEGKGSTFYFTIPGEDKIEGRKEGGINASVESKDPQTKKLKILIVEDDEMSSMLLENFLEPFAKDILQVFTGEDAVDICRQHPDIDLILMDIKLPGIDGAEATKQIRKFNKDVVIIAQTAKALTGDRAYVMEAGMNAYIKKPINKEELLQCVERQRQLGFRLRMQ